jgi:carboxypeptidase Taq
MHESQSRFFENMIGRSLEFWEFYLPKLKKIVAPIFDDVELIPFVHALNQIQNSLIRVEADEVTYSLHCLLRFEIERDLFAGKIKVKDLPQIWNAKIKEYFGLEVPNDTQGVLQDTHWAWGLFGYFPTYTLGNLYGAQFLYKLAKDIPDWEEKLKQGDVLTLKDWLTENIHQKGAIYDPLDLIKEVTGETLNPKYFIDYLKEKYSQLYGLKHST